MKNPANKFLDQDTSYTKAKAVVLPIPYEMTVSYGGGTKQGPSSIIKASKHLEWYDIELDTEPAKVGVHTKPEITPLNDPLKMLNKITKAAETILQDNKFLITLGGEHTISVGTVQAAHKVIPNLSILHFDAHLDLRKTYAKDPYSHACTLNKLREINKNTVSVGIRSMSAEEKKTAAKEKVKIYYASDIAQNGIPAQQIIADLTENVLISFDIDAIDPSVVEQTGTPEPGGLQWYETLAFLKELFQQRNVVGVDVLELAPNPAHPNADFTTAKLIYKMLGYKFNQ